MRRKDREMSKEFAIQVIDSSKWVTLGLIDTQGMPYTVPMQLVRQGENYYFHSAKEGYKLDCLRNNKNICITAVNSATIVPEEFTTKYQSATVRATAEEVLNVDEKKEILQRLANHYTPSHADKAIDEINQYINGTSIWKITVSEISGKEQK